MSKKPLLPVTSPDFAAFSSGPPSPVPDRGAVEAAQLGRTSANGEDAHDGAYTKLTDGESPRTGIADIAAGPIASRPMPISRSNSRRSGAGSRRGSDSGRIRSTSLLRVNSPQKNRQMDTFPVETLLRETSEHPSDGEELRQEVTERPRRPPSPTPGPRERLRRLLSSGDDEDSGKWARNVGNDGHATSGNVSIQSRDDRGSLQPARSADNRKSYRMSMSRMSGSSYSSLNSDISSASTRLRNNRKRLKNMGIGGEAGFWPGARQLRRIFRLFDVEGKGSITPAQFKKGLENLDFDVSNTQALSALVRELDTEHSGLIGEGAFITAFRNMNRQILEERLSHELRRSSIAHPALTGDDVHGERSVIMSVCDMGRGRKPHFRLRTVEAHEVGPVLSTKPNWKSHVRWVDIKGYSDAWLELVSSVLNLPLPVLEDMEFNQRAKVEYYDSHEVIQLVTHAVSLYNLPFQKKSYARSGEAAHRLISDRRFLANKPRLGVSQVHLFILDDHTLVTYRKHHEMMGLDQLFADLTPQLELHMDTLQGPFLLTAKSLATEVLDEISEHNWITCDHFKEWKKALEEAIRKGATSTHLMHILDLKTCTSIASNLFQPCMESLSWLTDEKYSNTPRCKFISTVMDDFRDVYETVARLYDSAKFIFEGCSQLSEFYKNQQDDKMNRTLYTLTVVTTVIAPMQLMTGIYGMNFDIMPDLHWKYSYALFWAVNIFLLIVLSAWLKRKQLL